jgi:hypothetical protein
VTTEEFIRFAERVAGRQLDSLFEEWLFAPVQPALPDGSTDTVAVLSAATASSAVPPVAAAQLRRVGVALR